MIDVQVSGSAIPRLSRREIIAFTRAAMRALRDAGATPFDPTELSIAFVSDRVMRSLNIRFRNRRKTTDVLTFAADPSEVSPDGMVRPLGEIAISVDQARRQATALRHSLAREIRYLILHGLIHACGYDHETDDGEMNDLELAIRESVGLE